MSKIHYWYGQGPHGVSNSTLKASGITAATDRCRLLDVVRGISGFDSHKVLVEIGVGAAEMPSLQRAITTATTSCATRVTRLGLPAMALMHDDMLLRCGVRRREVRTAMLARIGEAVGFSGAHIARHGCFSADDSARVALALDSLIHSPATAGCLSDEALSRTGLDECLRRRTLLAVADVHGFGLHNMLLDVGIAEDEADELMLKIHEQFGGSYRGIAVGLGNTTLEALGVAQRP